MRVTSLTTIFNRNGTDKLWLHHYDEEYIRHFEPLRTRPLKLLEIGIGGYSVHGRGGHSLKAWRDYGPEWQVLGIDIEDKSFLDEERVTTRICDQSKPEQLEELNEIYGPFDIIIDDGSHRQSDIAISFYTLFPCLVPGGIYVIEDLETAYREDYGGSPEAGMQPTIGLLQRLIDGLHWKFWKGRGPTPIDKMVKSLHISHELAFIYKR